MQQRTKSILFDQNVPRNLARHLRDHRVELSFNRGWSALSNGELIAAAEAAGFDVMITADQNLQYQQNLAGRQLAIVVLDTNRWRLIEPHVLSISAAIAEAAAGSFQTVRCF